VPINQSQLIFEALKKTGVSAHFHTIHGAGHGGPGFNDPEVTEMVSAFFDQRLKGGTTTAGAPEAKTTESTAAVAPAKEARPGGVEARGQMPSFDVILGRDDTNRDGKISRDEFRGPPALFPRLDRNGDGVITREEHEAVAAPPGGKRP
jgi:hypothetical protein